MARSKRGGRVVTSTTPPQLFAQQRKNSTETKYRGLIRDNALVDLTAPDQALNSVLKSVQDPAEAFVLGEFQANDLQILDAVTTSGLKREDFEILRNASIEGEVIEEGEEKGALTVLINPRQRISDRIKQFESFAGRGTVYQGQGTVLFKYFAPDEQYNHKSPPPFFTKPIGPISGTLEVSGGIITGVNTKFLTEIAPQDTIIINTTKFTVVSVNSDTSAVVLPNNETIAPTTIVSVENAPDFIPFTEEEKELTHRVGFIQGGEFIPAQEQEWWWNGEYNLDFRQRSDYGNSTQTALTNPSYPIIRDGNIQFSNIIPKGINSQSNWGLRFDAWFKHSELGVNSKFMRWVVQVYGQIRIDYFERTGYDSETGKIQGEWKTAIDTTNPDTYYLQTSKEQPTSTIIGSRVYYLQGGPSTPLGTGLGTLPTQRTPADGGALDVNETFLDREGNSRSKFNNDYVPVVIRFWYGKPDPNEEDPAISGPNGPASFSIDMIDTNLGAENLPKWNDYSAQIKFQYNSSENAWVAEGAESSLGNFTDSFEVVSHGIPGTNPPQPNLTGYISPQGNPIIATKINIAGVIKARFNIPGITPSNNDRVWVIAKNRPWIVLPEGADRRRDELWQRYLFSPNPLGRYKTADDLLDGVGNNYVEPDPILATFEENPNYYKAKYAELPSLNTYGSARYDGMLRNSITTSSTSRDYDYSHNKLLLIGRQKKDTGIKPLAPEEVRKNGENYTFIEVVKNRAGRGGNVKINAYPTNNLSVLATNETNTQIGRFLHMADNIKTFTNPSKQNVPGFDPLLVPTTEEFGTGSRIRYEEYSDGIKFVYGTGSSFTPDSTGKIAQLPLSSNSAFLTGFRKESGEDYYFYGMVSVIREVKLGETLTITSENKIQSEVLFNNGESTSTEQYLGTEIKFGGDNNTYKVIEYTPSESTITIFPAKAEGTYAGSQITYNHFSLRGSLPEKIVDINSAERNRSTILPVGEKIQLSLVFNGAYQYSRVDNGAGLSFGEVLYSKAGSNPTPSRPFVLDAELPAPPADIVVPFGYDNSPTAGDPGLGGLCYPPYSTQNPTLRETAIDDTDLYSATAGNFDVWWGSKQDVLNLGNKSLTLTDKLLFDFDKDERGNLLVQVPVNQRPAFTGSEYTHKLEVELNVEIPGTLEGLTDNSLLYEDAKLYSNNSPVKDRYYLFINNVGQALQVLSPPDGNFSW